jgi:hypothetical protein
LTFSLLESWVSAATYLQRLWFAIAFFATDFFKELFLALMSVAATITQQWKSTTVIPVSGMEAVLF